MTNERWLITGASGQLGGHLIRRLSPAVSAADLLAIIRPNNTTPPGCTICRNDLADPDALRRILREFRPTHVIHAAAMTAVAECYRDPDAANRLNAVATGILAETTAEVGGRFIYTSTDMVFYGDDAPYGELDEPSPPSVYGHSKLAGERAAGRFKRTLVVRIPLMYGFPAVPRDTTFTRQVAALRAGDPLRLFTDEFRTPAWLADVARALVGLAQSEYVGFLHVAGPERLSRYDLVAECARFLGIAGPRLVPISRLAFDSPEPRPADLSLRCEILRREFPELLPGPMCREAFAEQDSC